jgi:hypothetical protein
MRKAPEEEFVMTPISTRIVVKGALVCASVCLSISFFVGVGEKLTVARAQTTNAAKADKPLYLDYKGVQIDMSQEEVRKKLGAPKDKDDSQDFYLFSEQETAQVFYRAKKVFAVSVSYMGAKASAPGPKAVIGTELEPAADGRIYKIVRYPEAGYWVSYSRISGDEPMITVTMQKLQ